MLKSINHLIGYKLAAKDEHLGKVQDFLFDDLYWSVRYLVADTRRWLPGRKVLISPYALGEAEWATRLFPVDLTAEQIRNGPPISEDEPVSRKWESLLSSYYGWPMYWGGPGAGVLSHLPFGPRALAEAEETMGRIEEEKPEDSEGSNLRSANEVSGYAIHASDGEIGRVADFIVEDGTWILRYLVVDTKKRSPGSRKVLLAPNWIEAIDWKKEAVSVLLAREEIENSPEFEAGQPVNREYEMRLYDYYGRPVYWESQEQEADR
jgi:hypothetical protein